MAEAPDSLYAWIAEGDDSFIAVCIARVWYPMVFASRERATADRVMVMIRETVEVTGKGAALFCYTGDQLRTPLSEITPHVGDRYG